MANARRREMVTMLNIFHILAYCIYGQTSGMPPFSTIIKNTTITKKRSDLD